MTLPLTPPPLLRLTDTLSLLPLSHLRFGLSLVKRFPPCSVQARVCTLGARLGVHFVSLTRMFVPDEALLVASEGATCVCVQKPQARKMLEAEEAERQEDGGE